MNKSGFFGIGIQNGKNTLNYGTLFRTAQIFDADFLFVIGARFKRQSSDTAKSYRHMPVYSYPDFEDFNQHRPYGCSLIGIEMVPGSVSLNNFVHPKQACYLLGAEDHGISGAALARCQAIVRLPGERSLNVAVAGSIVLYDRIAKEQK